MWKFHKNKNGSELAYQEKDGFLLINDQICYYKDPETKEEVLEVSDESETIEIKINPDNSFQFINGFNELTQFNCCNSLMHYLELIKMSLDTKNNKKYEEVNFKDVLTTKPCFEVVSSDFDKEVAGERYDFTYDHVFSFKIGDATYSAQQMFVKYVFINESLADKTWTIEELYNFCLHMMDFLYKKEKEKTKLGYEDTMAYYLNVDKEVVAIVEDNI